MNSLFLKARPIIERIEAAGYEAYFVGGAVRDDLLNRPISDVDIATSATPEEIKAIFENTVDIGIEHGTVLVLYNGEGYEITTFRAESDYQDFRRPDEVRFIRSLLEDLQRRDFTMNAIAMDKSGELIDPFGGLQSLLQKRIETVGNAEERFSEDALRMMRAVRFVSQLSFTLDPVCKVALRKMVSLLKHIAVERISAEFEKIMDGKNRRDAIKLLCELNLDQYLPGLSDQQIKIDVLSQFACEELELDEMWSLLLFLIKIKPEETESFLRSWKLPVKRIRKIQAMTRWLGVRIENNWDKLSLFDAGKETVICTERVFNVLKNQNVEQSIMLLVERYEALPIKSLAEIEVTGQDLMIILNRKPGPWIKETLRMIGIEMIEKRLENNRERIREWVLSCNLK